MKKFLALALLGVLGCSAVDKIEAKLGSDLDRTIELSSQYGKPEVQKCAIFLRDALNSTDVDQANLDKLLKEPTSGLLSAALKAALIADYAKSLNDPAKQDAFKKGFDTNCASVAGQIVINLARDARKVGTRGN